MKKRLNKIGWFLFILGIGSSLIPVPNFTKLTLNVFLAWFGISLVLAVIGAMILIITILFYD